MYTFYITAHSFISAQSVEADSTGNFLWKNISSRPNERFGRFDLLTKYALAAVELLNLPLDEPKDSSKALILETQSGSLAVDEHYYSSKQQNPPSPALFTYTLPSVALGEIAIRYRLTGPNLTILSQNIAGTLGLLESARMLWRKECSEVIFIMANGTNKQNSLFKDFSPSSALALRLGSTPTASKLKLVVNKMENNPSPHLPIRPLISYLEEDAAGSWESFLQLGNNGYNLKITAI